MSKYDPVIMKCPVERDNPAVYRYTGCIDCGSCVRACHEQAGVLGYYDAEETDKALCIHCGQCAAECVGFAMQPRTVINKLRREMGGGKLLVASLSPAVRVAVAESFGFPEGSMSEGKVCSLLRSFGFDRVLDTNTAADITVMEESAELLRRFEENGPFPMFSSCCPAWLSFAEIFYSSLLPHISTTKSPVAIQGTTVKSWYAEKMDVSPEDIVHVAVTPCTAKSAEILRPELAVNGVRATDYVLTARELVDWAKENDVNFAELPESGFDSLMGDASGAAALFGRSGGVVEAVLRTLAYLRGEQAKAGAAEFKNIAGLACAKEAEVDIGGLHLRVAVVHGTANARSFIENMQKTGRTYHFVEVMACPGGCIGGGGQPKRFAIGGCLPSLPRQTSLDAKDRCANVRFSHENREVERIYREFYGEPLSEKALEYLHCSRRSAHAEAGDAEN